jgi:hypothetical protein
MDNDFAVCKRCLLEETDEAGLYKTLREIIDAIPDEHKASGGLYMKRLDTCRACDRLVSGMCVLCGCYVELRAAKNAQRCPDGAW